MLESFAQVTKYSPEIWRMTCSLVRKMNQVIKMLVWNSGEVPVDWAGENEMTKIHKLK